MKSKENSYTLVTLFAQIQTEDLAMTATVLLLYSQKWVITNTVTLYQTVAIIAESSV